MISAYQGTYNPHKDTESESLTYNETMVTFVCYILSNYLKSGKKRSKKAISNST